MRKYSANWTGQGRAMEESWDNCNRTTIKNNNKYRSYTHKKGKSTEHSSWPHLLTLRTSTHHLISIHAPHEGARAALVGQGQRGSSKDSCSRVGAGRAPSFSPAGVRHCWGRGPSGQVWGTENHISRDNTVGTRGRWSSWSPLTSDFWGHSLP